jgi:hypothetical protein
MLSKALSRVQDSNAVKYVEEIFTKITSAFKKRLALNSMRSASSESIENDIVREQLRAVNSETSNFRSIF